MCTGSRHNHETGKYKTVISFIWVMIFCNVNLRRWFVRCCRKKMQFHISWTLIWSTVRVAAVEIIIELPWLWGKTPLFLVITPSMLCWVFPCLAGCQTRFPASPDDVLPAVELISPPNKWKWIQKRLQIQNATNQLTFLSSICMHGHGKKKNIFHFLLIAALPDTRAVGSAIGCCVPAKLWGITAAHVHRATHKHVHTHTENGKHTAWKLNADLLMSCHGDRYCHLIGW